MLNLIKKILRIILPDEKVWELKNKHNIPSMEWSLMNLKRLGIQPKFAIDVGAFNGDWTCMFKKIFPLAKVFMVEAQYEKQAALKAISEKLPHTSFHIALLGAEPGIKVTFNVNSTVSSVLEEYKPNNFTRQIREQETLDDVVLTQNLLLPDFIKLDVQGYELEVLKGAEKILPNIQFVLCEVSLIEINKGCPLIADVIQFLDDKGFAAYDICSFIRRPLDNALWQTDLLFIRKTHLLTQNKYWS